MAASSDALSAPSGVASRGSGQGPIPTLARRAFRDGRTRTIAFAYLFGVYSYVQPLAYRHGYPTLSSRLAFSRSFAGNKAVRLFYGEPHSLLTVNGYAAWRVGGTLAIFAAVFGLLAAVRALRAEEESGRMELVLANVVGRRAAYVAALAAIGVGVLLLWLAEWLGLLVAGLPAGGAAYLALATASVVPVCVGVGAVSSQLAPTRRLALELGGAVLGVLFLLRVVADTASGVGWLRWLTPLGWAEELRPFAGPRPLVLLLPLAASALLLTVAGRIATGRDVGTGTLPQRDTAEPRLGLLSSPLAQALRSERMSLVVWLGSVGAFSFILGVLAKSSSSAGISKSLSRELSKLGTSSVLTPTGYLGFTFLFVIVIVSLFACAQIGAARHEEVDQRLETLLALPVSRRSWLAGRLALAAAGATAVSLVAGVLTWIGAESGGASVSLPKLIAAGGNCLPVGLLFLGAAALAYAVAPRASAGIAYGLVALAFLWDLVGSLLGAPRWLIELTPFDHVGLVPAEPFRAGAAAAMLAIGALASAAAIAFFARRDLTGA
jgi:ABC-2 type transport system permease protein